MRISKISKFRPILFLILAGVGVFALLLLAGFMLKPELREEPITYSREEIRQTEALRDLSLDREISPVVWQDVDYSEGTGASWYPQGESPILAELVEEGKLPPVDQRVGPEPLVLRGVDGIGNYGGTWFRIAATPGDIYAHTHRLSACSLVRWSPQGYPIVAHLAKGWETSPDKKEWTFFLREGVRWSDGHPFTADDILYRWEAEIKLLEPEVTSWMRVLKRPGEVIKVDDYTVRFVFPEPNGIFLEKLIIHAPRDYYAPRHYLEKYHPHLGDDTLIEAAMKAGNYPSRRTFYESLQEWNNPEHPRLWPWIYRTYKSNPPHAFVRNPYYWAVDREGNQLPYVDRIFYETKSYQLLPGAAAAGAITMQAYNVRFADYTLLMSQREAGGYQVYHWYPGARSLWAINLNLNRHIEPDDPSTSKRSELLNEKRFRQALSLAINREQIIEAEYDGVGEPSQLSPGPKSIFAHEESARRFTRYDPELANRLLDEIGLTRRDGEGYRTFKDGSRMVWYLDYTDLSGPGPAQFVIDDWSHVGLRVIQRGRSRNHYIVSGHARKMDFEVSIGQGEFNPLISPRSFVPGDGFSRFARGFGAWYSNGGLEGNPLATLRGGVEPSANHPIRRTLKAWEATVRASTWEERKESFREVLEIAGENVWTINIATPPPQLAVVQNGFKNVPRNMVYVGIHRMPACAGAETFYFEESRDSPGAIAQIKREMTEITPLPDSLREGSLAGGEGRLLGRLLRYLFLGILGCVIILVGVKHPYIGRRFVILVPTLLIISIITFVIIQLPPGNYVEMRALQLQIAGDQVSQEELAQLRELFHLEDPVLKQYARWLGLFWFRSFDESDRGLLQGHMGLSMETQRPVNEVVGDRILLTFLISLGTILFTWVVALPIGIYSAIRQYSLADYIFTLIGFIGMCIPNFLLAILLIFISGKYFGINMSGLFSPEYAAQPEWTWGKTVDLMKHIWVPVVVLGVGGTGGMIRVMRGNLLDELRKPYVTTALAKGVRPFKLLMKYPVRLALNPFISGIGGIFPSLVSGGAIVAMVLGLTTVGPLMLSALMSEDMYLAGSMLMVLSLLGVLGTLVSDLLLLWLDPRIRMEGGVR